MDYSEFRRHVGKAGLTINQFAALIGVRPAAVSNYSKKGSVPRTYAMLAVLMGDAEDRQVDCRRLLERYGILSVVDKAGGLTSLDTYRALKTKRK